MTKQTTIVVIGALRVKIIPLDIIDDSSSQHSKTFFFSLKKIGVEISCESYACIADDSHEMFKPYCLKI